MIHFNELRITDDNKYIIIEAQIDIDNYYKNVFIDSVVIDTNKTYLPSGPSNTPIYKYVVEADTSLVYTTSGQCKVVKIDELDYPNCLVLNDKEKQLLRLIIPIDELDININKDILFVYVIASGTPDASTPCGLDNRLLLGTLVNTDLIYKEAMFHIKEVVDNCNINKNFLDHILLINAFRLALKTGNYIEAIKLWGYIIESNSNINKITGKCYG